VALEEDIRRRKGRRRRAELKQGGCIITPCPGRVGPGSALRKLIIETVGKRDAGHPEADMGLDEVLFECRIS
jgi:hypothetical protein